MSTLMLHPYGTRKSQQLVSVIVSSITQQQDNHSQFYEPQHQPSTRWAFTKLMLFSNANSCTKTVNSINILTDQIII